MKTSPTPSCTPRSGFTILELVVTVIIIAVIAVVALPMYKHAILKSRFSTVMPMAKAVADAQEVYYLGNNQYALGKEDLDIAPVEAENTQVSLSPAEEDEEYIYVAAHRTDIPNVRYIMYQKNSPKFASNIHCEAEANDEEALWLCEKGLQGTEVAGSLQGKNYKTFLLAGDIGGSSFKVCPENAVCNDEGNVTGCESGYYQEEQTCKQEKACDEASKIIRTACSENCGEEVKEGTCNVKTGQWENYTVTQACPVKPAETQTCGEDYSNSSASATHAVTCSESNGSAIWTEGEWDYTACGCTLSTKPNDYTSDCATGQTGIKTYTYVCNSSNQWIEQFQSTCTILYSGNTPSDFCKSNQSADGCAASTFENGAQCWAAGTGGCNGSTFETDTMCWARSSSSEGCNGTTFKSGSWCQSDTSDSCAGTYQSGSSCVATVTGACGAPGTVYVLGATCIASSNAAAKCAAGTPAQPDHTVCWDGNGNRGSQYCTNTTFSF